VESNDLNWFEYFIQNAAHVFLGLIITLANVGCEDRAASIICEISFKLE
jgi:hypothetical protein